MLDVKKYQEGNHFTTVQFVERMKQKYSQYDAPLHSKVRFPEDSGICLTEDAEAWVFKQFGEPGQEVKKKPNRRSPERVSWRTTKTKKAKLLRAFKRAGYTTMQAGIDYLADQFLAEDEKKYGGEADV